MCWMDPTWVLSYLSWDLKCAIKNSSPRMLKRNKLQTAQKDSEELSMVVAHACHPRTLGGWHRRIANFSPAWRLGNWVRPTKPNQTKPKSKPWRNKKCMLLSERSQSEQATFHSYYLTSWKRQTQRRQIGDVRSLRWEDGSEYIQILSGDNTMLDTATQATWHQTRRKPTEQHLT